MKEIVKCSLVKCISRGNRISFVFFNSENKSNPMRTVQIMKKKDKKSLFELYCLIMLGRSLDIENMTPKQIAETFNQEAKCHEYQLEIEPSKCGAYLDILKLKKLNSSILSSRLG